MPRRTSRDAGRERRVVRSVVDTVPPYVGITGDALETVIWQAIRKLDRARRVKKAGK